MREWAFGYFNVGYWGGNYWAPGGAVSILPLSQSFAPPATRPYEVTAGQTLGGPSGTGTPFTVQSP